MKKTTKDTYKAPCLLLSKWFIFSVMMVFLASCSGMRPPGYQPGQNTANSTEKKIDNNKPKSPEKNDNKKLNQDKKEFDLSSIEKFEQKVAQKNENLKIVEKATDNNSINDSKNNSGKEKITKGIMPLEKQISLLSEDQKKISNDMDEVKSDISKINKRLVKIEKMLKEDGNKNEQKKNKKAMPVNHQNEEKKPQKNNDEFIIYPDDHNKKEKPKTNKPEKPKKPVIKKVSTEKPEKQTRLFENAINKFNGKNYKRAIDLLTQINKDPNIQNSANYYIGRSYFEMNNYKKAIQYFESVLKSGKKSYKPDAKYMIAESHINMGKVNKAKEIYKEFMADFPANKLTPKVRKMLQKL